MLELRCLGAERTTPELETFVSALMTRSEAARGMRSDGLSAVIAQQPAAGGEPLSSERFVYALGMTAGGMLFAIVAGVGGYLFLRHSKATFELSQANAANA